MITIDTSSGKIEYKKNIILSPTWQPLELSAGGLKRFSVSSRKNVGLWLKGLLNDSAKVEIRLACYTSSNPAETPYFTQVQTVGPSEVELRDETLSSDASTIAMVIPLGISELVPYLEIQVKVGGVVPSPAEITESYVTFEGVN